MSPTSNRIALVAARWHADIVDQAVAACRAGLAKHGYTDVDVIEVSTPELSDVVRLEDEYGRGGTSEP